jgi:uncharacterized damage-inducible protein DinB
MSEDRRFPIGKFNPDFEVTENLLNSFIRTIEELPEKLSEAVKGLNEEQLDTSYRPEGWTIRQVVHHVADSHLNSFCRFKLALTEEVPTIRAYDEGLWAELPDSKMPIEASIKITEGIHERWTILLKSMSDEDFKKELNHPESGKWTLGKMLGLYDWHSKHHTAHITSLRERQNW